MENLILSRSPRMREILDKAWQDIQEGRGLPHEEFWEQFSPE